MCERWGEYLSWCKRSSQRLFEIHEIPLDDLQKPPVGDSLAVKLQDEIHKRCRDFEKQTDF